MAKANPQRNDDESRPAPAQLTAALDAARRIINRRRAIADEIARLKAEYREASDRASAFGLELDRKNGDLGIARRALRSEIEARGVESPRVEALQASEAALAEEVRRLGADFAAAEQRRDALNVQLGRVQTENSLPSSEVGVSLAAILAHQQIVCAARAQIATVETAIAAAKDELQRVGEGVSDLAALLRRREDMLAAKIDGQVTDGELAAVDAEIAAARSAADEVARGTELTRARLAGLERKLVGDQERHDAASAEHGEFLRSFLFGEAERAGAEYLEHAKCVRDAFLRVMALNELLRALTGRGGDGPLVHGNAPRVCLPSFRITGFEEYRNDSSAELFTHAGFSVGDQVSAATDAERQRLHALGVEC